MRIILITFALLLIGCINSLNAQKLYAHVGLNYADNYDSIYDINWQDKLHAINIGVAYEVFLTKSLSITNELEYIHKGAKGFTLSYLTYSPLLTKSVLNNKLKILVGPYVGLMLKYKAGSVDQGNPIELNDYGIDYGFSYPLVIKDEKFEISLASELGLAQFASSKHIGYQLKFKWQIN